jgi:hypothetical protein
MVAAVVSTKVESRATPTAGRLIFSIVVGLASVTVACGGETDGDAQQSGGGPASGGSGAEPGSGGLTFGTAGDSGSGGATPIADCPSVASQLPCDGSSQQCVGPCSNSWQVLRVCRDGTWENEDVITCGPNADEAPQCQNAFLGGALSPCCPEQLLCADKPDGYPGFGCTPGDGSYCSCMCQGGEMRCAC